MKSMASNGTDPAAGPDGVDPEARRIASAAPRLRPDQAERVKAIIARHRAGRDDTRAS